MNYFNEIKKSMEFLAKKNNTIFLGQSVAIPGNLLFKSLEKINNKKKLEMPVFEETQMGIAIGLALNGFFPVSCYPRFDFFILSLNQVINHLDKLKKISSNEFNPFLFIRVLVGSKKPIDAGLQHTQDHTNALKLMLKYTDIVQLKKNEPQLIQRKYKEQFKKKKTTVFIEYS